MKIRMSEGDFFVLMLSDGEIIGQGTYGDFKNLYSGHYWLISGNRNDASLEQFYVDTTFDDQEEIYGKRDVMNGISDVGFSRKQIKGGCLFFGVPKPVMEELLSFVHL